MDDPTTTKLERVAGPMYFLCFLFLALPFMDYVMNVWPLQPGQVNWRYGAFGLAGGFLLTPLLGFVLLAATGFFLGHRRTLAITALLSAICGLGLILLSMSFVLDSLQIRSSVSAAQKGVFDAGVVKALIKDLTGALLCVWVAMVSFRGSRGMAVSARRQPAMAPVVGAAKPQKI